MVSTRKAVLFSALVLPGTGQIMQKHFKRGIAIIVLILGALLIFISQILKEANTIIQNMDPKMLNPADSMAISQQAQNNLDNPVFNIAFYTIIFLWLFSIVDAIIEGKKQKNQQTN